MKLKRGQKLCNECNGINGARSYTCKHCGHEFKPRGTAKVPRRPRKPKKYEEIQDWRDLKSGDRIKVVGRSGTYYINSEGDRQYLTDAGIYTIAGIDDNGIHAHNGGYGYIYMGPEVPSDIIPNVYRSPHKILRANIPKHPKYRV